MGAKAVITFLWGKSQFLGTELRVLLIEIRWVSSLEGKVMCWII